LESSCEIADGVQQDEPENLLSIIQLFGDEFSEITKAYINGLRDVFNDAVSILPIRVDHFNI
jgi:hypothetical protein